MPDEDLMKLICDRDDQAFEVIFDRHADVCFSLAYRLCGRRQLAEDAVQEAFLSLWRSGVSYDHSRGSVRSWIFAVVRNRVTDGFRRDDARTGLNVSDDGLSEQLEATDRTDMSVERLIDAQGIRGALTALPEHQRKVIELAFYGGLSHSEIAALLDIPPGTVKGRMRLGLAKLRASIGDSIEPA